MNPIRIALAASLGLALARPALAADAASTPTTRATQDQDRDRVRAQVHHELTHTGEATEQEAAEVDADVNDHAGHGGYGPAIKKAIEEAHAAGCKGPCQVKLIHDINGAMDRGATPDAAARKATAAAAHASGSPSDPQAGSEDHRQDAMHRDGAADRSHDMAHDRAQDHGQDHFGGHAMGAGRH